MPRPLPAKRRGMTSVAVLAIVEDVQRGRGSGGRRGARCCQRGGLRLQSGHRCQGCAQLPQELLTAWLSEVPHNVERVVNEGELLDHPLVNQPTPACQARALLQTNDVGADASGECT